MDVPVHVTFLGIPVSESIEASCWSLAAMLRTGTGPLSGCRVMLRGAGGSNGGANGGFQVQIDLAFEGRELRVVRTPPDGRHPEDLESAVAAAFTAAREQLEQVLRDAPAGGRLDRDTANTAAPDPRDGLPARHGGCGT